MTTHAWWNTRVVAAGVCLGLAAPAPAGAFQLFPRAEIREAHALRQRILTETPQLDPQQRGQQSKLPLETIHQLQQRLNALQAREAENPFWYWAQGELVRQSQGIAPATAFFARARQIAGARFLVHWLLWQQYLARNLHDDARREEVALQGLQVAWGLTRFPLLATELMRSGDEAVLAGDPLRAAALYDAAVANTPESAPAHFGRAAYTWQADKTQLLPVMRDLLRGVALTLRSPQTRYYLTSNLVLSLVVTCLVALGVVAAVLALRVQPLFCHELNEGVLKSSPPPAQFSLGLLCSLLPLVLGFGLLWSAVLVLLISAPYLTVRERIGLSVLLALLVALPWGYLWVAGRHALVSSPKLALVQTVELGGRGEGLVQDLARWSREDPNNGLAHYYLGLTLKRRGELPQAEAAVARAAQRLPQASFAHVALGNLQYLGGQLPEAEASYRMAAGLSPSAAAQMNLFKLYAQRLQFEQSKDALSRSTELDPHMVQILSRFHGQGGDEFVVDETVPWDALVVGLVPATRDVAAMAEGLWGAPLRGVSLPLLPYVAVLLVILFWTNAALRGRMPRFAAATSAACPSALGVRGAPRRRSTAPLAPPSSAHRKAVWQPSSRSAASGKGRNGRGRSGCGSASWEVFCPEAATCTVVA